MGFDGWWKLIVGSRGFVWEGRVWRVRGVRATEGADMGNEGMMRVGEGRVGWLVRGGQVMVADHVVGWFLLAVLASLLALLAMKTT